MRSNYKRIGDYIRLVDKRNIDLSITTLLGLTINKVFIPSVANTVGTNMANYKIIKKRQFACSLMQVRRDKKIPVALQNDYEEAIISQAYPVFEIIDIELLLPEYLMMWMSRSEFDREACFYAVGGVRGSLEWDDFCNMELPVPDIEKQRALVKEYNTIVNRIKLNEELNKTLEETAQAIYKQWFVDFEFPFDFAQGKPDENGKPYKSNGGVMVWNEELGKEIPKGWDSDSFTKVVNLSGGGTPSTMVNDYWNGNVPFFTPADVSNTYYAVITEKNISLKGLKNCSSKLYPQNTVFVTARGTVGAIAVAGNEMAMNQSCYAVLGNDNCNQFFTHQLTLHTINKLKNEALGAVFSALVTKDFDGQLVIKSTTDLIKLFGQRIQSIYDLNLIYVNQNLMLQNMRDLILSKMTKA